jgi:hypothetical protein
MTQILSWADRHRRREGEWPSARSGAVAGAAGESWSAINAALRLGLRGLRGGDTLARLLRRKRGVVERRGRPRREEPYLVACRLRAGGLTLTEIGRRLGVSRQWVAQLLLKAGANGKAGPRKKRRVAR